MAKVISLFFKVSFSHNKDQRLSIQLHISALLTSLHTFFFTILKTVEKCLFMDCWLVQ